MERRRAYGTNVGEAESEASLHEAQGQDARLHSPSGAPLQRLHSGGLCK